MKLTRKQFICAIAAAVLLVPAVLLCCRCAHLASGEIAGSPLPCVWKEKLNGNIGIRISGELPEEQEWEIAASSGVIEVRQRGSSPQFTVIPLREGMGNLVLRLRDGGSDVRKGADFSFGFAIDADRRISLINSGARTVNDASSETAQAVPPPAEKGAEDSGVRWGTELPRGGSTDYKDSSRWYRLVLEYGGYSTNRTDSYAAADAKQLSAWPEYAWNNYYYANSRKGQPDDWLGKEKADCVSAGTPLRREDYSLYRNGEYSEDGLFSLYIKYAGKSRSGVDCWYISPCDGEGNREEKLWALQCCLNLCGETKNRVRALDMGYMPDFTLCTPSYDEFEGSRAFRYAGAAIPCYDGTDGAILGRYIDNHKWIIGKNADGSWYIKSAGCIEWDWSDPDGTFAKIADDPARALGDSLALLTLTYTFYKYAEDDIERNPNMYLPYAISRNIYDEQVSLRLRNFVYPDEDTLSRSGDGEEKMCWENLYGNHDMAAVPLAMTLFLSDFAQNVYITGGCYYRECRLEGVTNRAGENLFKEQVSKGDAGAALCVSYGMELQCALTPDDFISRLCKWYAVGRDSAAVSAQLAHLNDDMGIRTCETSPAADGEEEITRCLTADEIKDGDNLPMKMSAFLHPARDSGAFTGLYVGTPITTEVLGGDNAYITIGSGNTEVLGKAGKRSGSAEGMAHIGTLWKYDLGGAKGTGFGPVITIEKGAVLRIDGPTYAALGTTIRVKGSLIISEGAFLAAEGISRDAVPAVACSGVSVEIDGGTVYISGGAMLDTGYAALSLKNNGRLVNNGVFIQDTSDSRLGSSVYISMRGGSIENNARAWFISGAEVKNNRRLALIRMAGAGDIDVVAPWITGIDDSALRDYLNGDREKSVALRMYSDAYENAFRNIGSSLITGAVKGVDAAGEKVVGRFLGNGRLYRAADTVDYRIPDCSYEQHELQAAASGADAASDPVMLDYYSLGGISTGGIIVPDNGAETEAARSNLFALRVGTGSQSTDMISGFIIRYLSEDGRHCSELIDPSELEETYNFASGWEHCGRDENEVGTNALKSDALSGILSGSSFPRGLEAYSNAVYLFRTAYPLSHVEAISVSTRGSGSWSCTELNVYRVSYLFPVEEYGWRSEDWYIPFEGTLIAETVLTPDADGAKSESFTWESSGFEIGTGLYPLNVFGVPEAVGSKTDEVGAVCYITSADTVPYSTEDAVYLLSVSLADTSGGGIEAFYNVNSRDSLTALMSDEDNIRRLQNEVKLNMRLSYLDTNGSVRTVNLPLTQSAAEWAYASVDGQSRSAPIHGLFQQGEEIAFCGRLPDYSRATGAELTYTDNTGGASVSVASIAIGDSAVNALVRDGMLKTEHSDSAIDFFCAADAEGVTVENGQTVSFDMKKRSGTESLKPKYRGSRYLFAVETDAESETGNNIRASFTYKTLSGEMATTDTYSLSSLVSDYYGHWLSSDGQDADCAYRTAVSAGQQMLFVLELSNVYSFISATFSMDAEDAEGADNAEAAVSRGNEWQMNAIAVYELEELGERQVFLGEGISLPSFSTDRTYCRDSRCSSRGAVSSASGPLVIASGQSRSINLEKGGTSGDSNSSGGSEDSAADVSAVSFEETKQSFGFNSRRVQYTVTVQVAGDPIISAGDGDCGSASRFYFQLVFRDALGRLRTSPCVLANQQLRYGSFITGAAERFTVYTNGNYGTPVQVNVIPDDSSSTGDVFDKLKIDSVTVSKTGGTGVSMSWIAENVGWIDIGQKDGEQAQTEAVTHSFALKEAGYEVTFEFGIETAAEYVDDRQFSGQVLADISYRDTLGAVHTKSDIDVVSEIAAYAGRTSGSDSVSQGGSKTSLPDFMFKKGYTNRFHVKFSDISSLVGIRLRIIPDDDVTWKINRVFARQVFNEGTLSLNIFNEYERSYSISPQDVSASDNARAVSVPAVRGAESNVSFDFNPDSSIQIDVADGKGNVIVEEGVSEGRDDAISLTAELADCADIAADASLSARLLYKNIYGDAYAVNATLVFDGVSGKFMIPQNDLPETPDISMPYQVQISGGNMGGRQLEAVHLNQVRDRQSVEKYVFVPEGGTRLDPNEPTAIILPESDQDEYARRKGYTDEAQLSFLQLGSLTEKTLLSQTHDLQLALVYTEKTDPYGYEHISELVSALDNGYTVINKDMVLMLPLNIRDLGSVKSVLLKTSDSAMKVNVEKGCISLEQTSSFTGERQSTGWVNLPAKTALISEEATAMNTDGMSLEDAFRSNYFVSPLNISAQFTNINRSDAMIRVTVMYLDAQSVTHSVTCDKLASEWNRGSNLILADGLKSVQYYKVEAYDNDAANTAGVTIGSLSIGWYNSSGVYTTATYSGNTVLTEGVCIKNSLVTTQLAGTVSLTGGSRVSAIENNIVSTARTRYDTLTVSGTGDVSVSASLTGFPGELEMDVTSLSTGAKLFDTVSAAPAAENLYYSFSLPLNAGAETVHYCLSIRSKNIPELYTAKILIDVEPGSFIEGMVLGSSGVKELDIMATSGRVVSALPGGFVRPGDTIRVYARTTNGTPLIGASPFTGEITPYTVSAGMGVTVPGYEGTWTEYIITMGNVQSTANCTFALAPANSASVEYWLQFLIVPYETTDTGGSVPPDNPEQLNPTEGTVQ